MIAAMPTCAQIEPSTAQDAHQDTLVFRPTAEQARPAHGRGRYTDDRFVSKEAVHLCWTILYPILAYRLCQRLKNDLFETELHKTIWKETR